MPKFTKEQQLAIDLEGSNILVSAGAGSGKTAVLSERVLRKVKEGTKINELLILTFTNKAALEMKERIRKKLTAANLIEAANLIDSSYITTFDSYCLSLVKKYSDVLSLSKDINIALDSLLTLAKKEILTEIFTEYYKNPTPAFNNLIANFCLKDDSELQKKILELDSKLDLKLNKEEFLTNYLTTYYNEDKLQSYIKEYLNFLQTKKAAIINLYEEVASLVEGNYLEKLTETFAKFLPATSYEEMKKTLPLKLPNVRKGFNEEAKNSREKLNKALKEFKELVSYETTTEIYNSLINSKEAIGVIIEIIMKLDTAFAEYKRINNYYTFMDIEKLAIKLVKDDQEVREEVKNSFKEILIDEYQDTNDIQETFISYISDNNVYMVGDIKQSIYRFRNANPLIFKEKYDNYKANNGGRVIDLAKNFRSRKEVIEDINTLFSHIMDNTIGGADYNNGHAMIFGNNTYLEKARVDLDNHLEIYTYPLKNQKYTKVEQEAFLVANDIKEKIANKRLVYDQDLDALRPIDYKDFVILLDTSKNFTTYKQIFEYLSLPIVIYEDEKTSGSFDLAILKNIFLLAKCIITNDYQTDFKKAFASLARSFLFSYQDQELYDYLTNNTYKNSSLFQIFKDIDYQNISPSLFLEMILKATSYEEKILTLKDIDILSKRMEYFYSLVKNLENSNYSIIDISDYLVKSEEEKLEIKLALSKDDSNSIKIMTIHKSKGLEYPVCYFADFYKKFNKDEYKSSVLFSDEYGIIIPDFTTNNKLITKTLLNNSLLKEDISERIRLLYVALTRAREKMIIVMPEVEEITEVAAIVSDYERLNYTNFAKMIYSVLSLFTSNIKKYDSIPNISKDYLITKNITVKPNIEDKIIIKDSLYQKEIIEKETYHKESASLKKSEEQLNLLEFGSKVHTLFERIDFVNNKVPSTNDPYLKTKLTNFLNSNFMNQCQTYRKYQEYEFIYQTASKKYHGIIDLLMIGDKEVVIIDYKLKNTSDKAYIEQLKGYKEAIMTKLNKETSCYLYSIISEEFVKIC